MNRIPMKTFPAYTMEVTLDLIPYRFDFHWNYRGEFWTLNVLDREQQSLVMGIRLALGFDLFDLYPDRGLPPGQLFVVDPTGSEVEIGRNDFTNGRELEVIYVTENES